MNKPRTLKIGISGIRGIIGDSLSPGLLTRFAQSFGTYLNGGTVVVARDTRSSGELVKSAVFAGLMATGCRIIDLDICPVPTLQIMIRKLNADGGIMISASHNPAEWNALKFYQSTGMLLNPLQAEQLVDIYHQGEFKRIGWQQYQQETINRQAISTHLDEIINQLNPIEIPVRNFTVAIDCCNGAGAVVTPLLLKRLGCKIVPINIIPDGKFPRNPEPIPENLNALSKLVVDNKADVGFAQDADADRLAIVDETGRIIGEEYTLALVTEYLLRKFPQSKVVVNLSTSQMIDDIAQKYRSQVYRSKVGEINVVELIQKVDGLIGGEGNGGVIFPQINYGRDSFVAITLILQFMATAQVPLSQLVDRLPKYYMVKTKLSCPADKIFTMIRLIQNLYLNKGMLNTEDGIKIILPDVWIHLRASNTEPIIRIICESQTAEYTQQLNNQIVSLINKNV